MGDGLWHCYTNMNQFFCAADRVLEPRIFAVGVRQEVREGFHDSCGDGPVTTGSAPGGGPGELQLGFKAKPGQKSRCHVTKRIKMMKDHYWLVVDKTI